MRRSEAARYAQWAAGAAILVTLTVAGVFAYRSYEAARVRRQAPPVVPPTVQKRSAEFSFSKVEQDRTLFTVRASRTTEYKAGGLAQLEDVWITIYGRQKQRFDNVHTRECDYAPDTGRITCAGEVQIDLESAEEAKERPGQRVIHVGTMNVSFNRETGELHTDNPVVFRFPYGHGRGIGVTYSTHDAKITLHRDVELTLTSDGKNAKSAEPVVVSGSGLEYRRDDRTMRLLPPVRVKQGERLLTAAALALEFDAALHARRMIAGGHPQLESLERRGQLTLSADEIVTLFRPEGWAERIAATGNVDGQMKNAAGEDHLHAQRAVMEMEPGRNLARSLEAQGNVALFAERHGSTRRLETEALRISFTSGSRPSIRRADHAETLAPATLTLLSPGKGAGQAPEESTRVHGERMAAVFDARSTIRQMTAGGGVEVERRLGNRPPQLTSSREMVMKFQPGGEWSEAEQSSNVRFKEGERTAQADRARMVRSSDLLTLTGGATVSDRISRTTAAALSFNQRSGEIRGDGGVRTSYFQAERNGVTNMASQPAHISSEQLLANRTSGRALYTGHARLWQGDSVIEANSIEILREEQRLDALGNVVALLPQETRPATSTPQATASASPAARTMWRARSAKLTYWSAEGRAHLEDDVNAQSQAGQINARTLDLFLGELKAGSPQTRGVTRGLAGGGVTVRQGERRGTADRAEYVAAEGKFVLSGGRPTLYDAEFGTTTGRQLTFFLSDDKILVDSEEGSRTLSRHRVEK